MIFWGFERSGVTKDRLFHHRMFGSWLFDLPLVPYIQETLVPHRGRSSISNKQRGLRRCRSFPWTPSSWSKRKSSRHNACMMLSSVLLLIQRALITPLRIFPQRSLFLLEADQLRSLNFSPLSVGFFIIWSVWRLDVWFLKDALLLWVRRCDVSQPKSFYEKPFGCF